MNLSELKQDGFVAKHIMVFGPPKSGKTELVGALASEGYKLHWFDLESGIGTLLRPDSKAKAGLGNIEYFKVPDTQELPQGYQTIDKIIKNDGPKKICALHGAPQCFACIAKEKTAPGTVQWNTIDLKAFGPKDVLVIDSVSQLVASTLCNIMKDDIIKGNDDAKPEWAEWRKQGFLLDRIFGRMQAGNYNVIGISHEEEQKLESGAKRLVPVGGTGNFSKTFAKYWSEVVYTDVINGTFRAYSAVEPGVNAIVGSRAGKKLSVGQGLIELFK